jgi:hypothetical protein
MTRSEFRKFAIGVGQMVGLAECDGDAVARDGGRASLFGLVEDSLETRLALRPRLRQLRKCIKRVRSGAVV